MQTVDTKIRHTSGVLTENLGRPVPSDLDSESLSLVTKPSQEFLRLSPTGQAEDLWRDWERKNPFVSPPPQLYRYHGK